MNPLKERSAHFKRALLVGRASKAIQLRDKFSSGRSTAKMKLRNLTFGRKRDYKRKQNWMA